MRLLALAVSRSLTVNRPLRGRLVTPTITGRLPASLGDRTFTPKIGPPDADAGSYTLPSYVRLRLSLDGRKRKPEAAVLGAGLGLSHTEI